MNKFLTPAGKLRKQRLRGVLYGVLVISCAGAIVVTCNSEAYNRPYLHLDINKPNPLLTDSVALRQKVSIAIAEEVAIHGNYNPDSSSVKSKAVAETVLETDSRKDRRVTPVKTEAGINSLSKEAQDAAISFITSSARDSCFVKRIKNISTRKRIVPLLNMQVSAYAPAISSVSLASVKVAGSTAAPVSGLASPPVSRSVAMPVVSKNDVTVSSETAGAMTARGNSRARLQDYNGAISAYSSAIEKEPDSSGAYLKRAEVRLLTKDYRGADLDYTRAISLGVTNRNAYKGRAIARLRQNNFKGSLSDYNKIMSRSSAGELSDSKDRGDASLTFLDYKGAEAHYTSAILHNSQDKEAYRRRAEAEFYQHNYTGALMDLTKAIHIDPGFAEAYVNRGVIKSVLKQKDDAFIDFNQARGLGDRLAGIYIEKYCN